MWPVQVHTLCDCGQFHFTLCDCGQSYFTLCDWPVQFHSVWLASSVSLCVWLASSVSHSVRLTSSVSLCVWPWPVQFICVWLWPVQFHTVWLASSISHCVTVASPISLPGLLDLHLQQAIKNILWQKWNVLWTQELPTSHLGVVFWCTPLNIFTHLLLPLFLLLAKQLLCKVTICTIVC